MLTDSMVSDIYDYYNDMPDRELFQQEILRWKIQCSSGGDDGKTEMLTILKNINTVSFPNISFIFRTLLLLPVTPSTVERSNSALYLLSRADEIV